MTIRSEVFLCVERVEDNEYELGYYGTLKNGRKSHNITYRKDKPRFITSHVDKVHSSFRSEIKEHKQGMNSYY